MRTYDLLDRQLSQATSVVGAGSAATSAGYAYNAASQRTNLTREDGSSWSYGYDALGQVTGGSRKWSDATPVAGQQFAYAFDQIGNRQTATVNGRVSSYSPNLLNQYESRTVPGAVDVLGSAQPEAIVTVNGQLTTRKGEYYAGTAPVNNTSAAMDAELKIVGVRNHAGPAGEDAVTEQTGRAFVPQTPESFTHDLDGNLTGDGRFSYTWDGENRLIAVEAHATTPATAKVKVRMLYDAHSRRVQKQVYTWNAGTSTYQLSTTLRFLYDGWNLITELTASNQVVRSYAWGLDLSGTLQGAGGVGGLLVITDAATGNSYLPAYDGNGNILALINATDSTLAAQYDYGPFGEPLRATGAMAKVNPFRWSTRYTDDETGLVMYPLRPYQPTTGRWLSRDHAEEQGGENLYGFVDNDPVGYIDALGLWKAKPGNKGKDLAEYEAEKGDTIAGLAGIRGLKASEYKKWLTGKMPASENEEVCGNYKVPNTVIAYWAGAGGFLGRLYTGWRGNVSRLKSQGYKVEEYHFKLQKLKKAKVYNADGSTGYTRALVGTPEGDLQAKLTAGTQARKLHGLYFWGHGGPSGLSADSGNYFGPQTEMVYYRTVSVSYGLPLLWIYSCYSASAQPVLGSGEPGMDVRGSATGTLIPLPFGFYIDTGE
jgi:RHS repeat-associated protein